MNSKKEYVKTRDIMSATLLASEENGKVLRVNEIIFFLFLSSHFHLQYNMCIKGQWWEQAFVFPKNGLV